MLLDSLTGTGVVSSQAPAESICVAILVATCFSASAVDVPDGLQQSEWMEPPQFEEPKALGPDVRSAKAAVEPRIKRVVVI